MPEPFHVESSPGRSLSNGARGWVLYLVILGCGVGGFLAVRAVGEGMSAKGYRGGDGSKSPGEHAHADVGTAPVSSAAHKLPVVFHVLVTLAAVIGLGYVLGQAFRWIGQPPVIGEVVAGIALGPSILGAISPHAMQFLMPGPTDDPQGQTATALKMIAQLGVILYMFVVGLELNAAKLKQQASAAILISHVSIVVPFLLGAALALGLYRSYAPAGVAFTSFALFLGVSMAITAFPVLARILTDRDLEKSPLGMLALACAAADDATAWCLLALVVGIVQAQVESALFVAIGSLVYVVLMLFVVRPALVAWCRRLDQRDGPLHPGVLLAGLLGVLLSSLATEKIGIHAIFGAFLFGAIIPPNSRLAAELKIRLRDSATMLMLPAFFAYTGMRTEIGLVSGWENWLTCAAIIFVATLGKLGGTLLAARATGFGWRESTALGMLMNTRGLMGLIVLDVGLDLGVISPALFTMMVLMALVTTLMTSPVVMWLLPR